MGVRGPSPLKNVKTTKTKFVKVECLTARLSRADKIFNLLRHKPGPAATNPAFGQSGLCASLILINFS